MQINFKSYYFIYSCTCINHFYFIKTKQLTKCGTINYIHIILINLLMTVNTYYKSIKYSSIEMKLLEMDDYLPPRRRGRDPYLPNGLYNYIIFFALNLN